MEPMRKNKTRRSRKMKIAYIQPPDEERIAYALEDALKALSEIASVIDGERDPRRAEHIKQAIVAVLLAADPLHP
jgi:hypothetical protein